MSLRRNVNNSFFHSVKHVEFCVKKKYLREILLHYFILKKSAVKEHRILVETYALSDNNMQIGLDAPKIMILIKNALTHRKSMKAKNWRH